ncbi:MAG: J domain-containing protein [Spirochaetaceae bacterium]|nr:MAG: J domain-containing protein [Spirochaetaceae bacterium]
MHPFDHSTNTDGCRPPVAVIDRIAELEASGGPWSLGAGEIRDLLGISDEEFYRGIYAAESRNHPLVSLSASTGTFSQENIWEFVALIELFCGPETETRLEKAGIFFSHPEQMEILGVFLGETAAVLRRHELDAEQFSAMLRTFGSFEAARDIYIEEYFPLAGLIDRAAAAYCGGRSFSIPGLAESNAKALIRFFFQKHVLQVRGVFAALIERLLRQAVEEGYAAEQADDRRRDERDPAGGPDPSSLLQRARRAMNLEGRILTLPLLKAQYKRLMKIYHPDINPQGLRRCQEITAAYSLLLSAL